MSLAETYKQTGRQWVKRDGIHRTEVGTLCRDGHGAENKQFSSRRSLFLVRTHIAHETSLTSGFIVNPEVSIVFPSQARTLQ